MGFKRGDTVRLKPGWEISGPGTVIDIISENRVKVLFYSLNSNIEIHQSFLLLVQDDEFKEIEKEYCFDF